MSCMDVDDPQERQTLGPFHPAVIQGVEIRRTTSVGTAEREDGRWTWHVVRNTERIQCRVRRGRVEIDGNIEVFKGGRQKRVR